MRVFSVLNCIDINHRTVAQFKQRYIKNKTRIIQNFAKPCFVCKLKHMMERYLLHCQRYSVSMKSKFSLFKEIKTHLLGINIKSTLGNERPKYLNKNRMSAFNKFDCRG